MIGISLLSILTSVAIFLSSNIASAEMMNASGPGIIGSDEYEVFNAALDGYDGFVAIEIRDGAHTSAGVGKTIIKCDVGCGGKKFGNIDGFVTFNSRDDGTFTRFAV